MLNSRLDLNCTGSRCLANTIVAYEILHVRSKEPPLDSKENLSQTMRVAEVAKSCLDTWCYRKASGSQSNVASDLPTHAGIIVVPTESSGTACDAAQSVSHMQRKPKSYVT